MLWTVAAANVYRAPVGCPLSRSAACFVVALSACTSAAPKATDTDVRHTDVLDTDVAGADTDAAGADTDAAGADTDLSAADALAACLSAPGRNPTNGLDGVELCPGDLVITELLVDPQDCAGSAAKGQHLEVFNASGVTVHLAAGLMLDFGAHLSDLQPPLGDADVEPGARFVVRPLQFQAYCHDGPEPFTLWTPAILLEAASLRLHNGVDTIDAVDFTGWTHTPGVALELRPGALPPTADANDLRDAWCDAGTTMLPQGSLDRGSPGAPNACAP